MAKLHLKLTILLVVFGVFVGSLVLPQSHLVYSRTSSDVQNEIEQARANLENINRNLRNSQAELNKLSANLNSVTGEIPRLEAEIKKLEASIEYNNLQAAVAAEAQKIKELEREKLELHYQILAKQRYINQRKRSGLDFYTMLSSERMSPIKRDYYQSYLLGVGGRSISDIESELAELQADLNSYEEENTSLGSKTAELKRQKAELEASAAYLRGNINNTRGAVAGLRTQSSRLQANIAQLSEEQRALQEYERYLLSLAARGGSQQLQAGQYYFWGKGRDLYQGHGVGMSQYGAKGAAEAGWSAAQILSFYYKQTRIEQRPGTISVQGYGTMDSNTYAAGIGEVPNKACGTAAQVAARPDKYVIDNPNTIWDCWPEEAIKAMVIAARSYGRAYNGTVCTTASCQVYVGGNGKQWAADETRDMVIISSGATHNNQIISAIYSSDNNQGYGTANNDTVFSNMAGDGTPYSYLRHVNDTNISRTYYSSWTWRSDGFQIADLQNMLSHVNRQPNLSHARNYVNGMLGAIGDVANVELIKDQSNRVRKVKFTGSNGVSREMAGWLFKTIWNSWVANERPHGEVDYIYSLTFFLLRQ